MKLTEPKVDERPDVPYMGIRTQVPMEEMGSGLIPITSTRSISARAHNTRPACAVFSPPVTRARPGLRQRLPPPESLH